MANRLDPLNLASFVGGLNLRRNPLALAEDESPDMLNVDVDPRGGFVTRKGWQRWNDEDVVDVATTEWAPRNQFSHTLADRSQNFYIVNDKKVYVADETGAAFVQVPGIVAEAPVHGSDFCAWGDDVYIVPGTSHPPVRREVDGTLTTMGATFSEVDTPVFNVMPQADYVEAHAGYVFVASTTEAATPHPTRLRWSHPNRPDAWRESDFIDIDSQGGRITGIMAFMDHLLIFKTNNLWALYGYNEDSWQLVRVSTSIGCPCTTAASRSEKLAFFFSASDKGGIYAYNGSAPLYITERLRPAFEQVFAYENVFVSWAGRRLWVSVPWRKDLGSTTDPATCFVFDPDTGESGAWTMYRSDYGAIGPVMDASDINGKLPLATLWSDETACVVILDAISSGAYDIILQMPYVLGAIPDAYLTTGADEEIELTGPAFLGQPFETYYRTRWLHAGWPDRKKSWRRPTFICKEVSRTTELLVESYRDYDETTIRRTRRLIVPAKGQAFWTEGGFAEAEAGGFDWTPDGADDATGTGADWSAAVGGSKMVRGGSLGLARAVQMKISPIKTSERQAWGVDGIVAKLVLRRFR